MKVYVCYLYYVSNQMREYKPLFGNRSGKQSKTIWMTFMKEEDDK